jgi:hypothetical protein
MEMDNVVKTILAKHGFEEMEEAPKLDDVKFGDYEVSVIMPFVYHKQVLTCPKCKVGSGWLYQYVASLGYKKGVFDGGLRTDFYICTDCGHEWDEDRHEIATVPTEPVICKEELQEVLSTHPKEECRSLANQRLKNKNN